MTHPEQTPQRRKVDRGHFRRLRAWWERWGGLVNSLWLFAVTAVVLVVAVQFWHSQAATATAARVACERSRDLGPPVLADYQHRHVLTVKQLERYRTLIPKTCPAP